MLIGAVALGAARVRRKWQCMLALVAGIGSVAVAVAPSLPLERIRLPAGFVIETVARVPNARAMTAVNRILRCDAIERRLDAPPLPAVVSDDFAGATYWMRYRG